MVFHLPSVPPVLNNFVSCFSPLDCKSVGRACISVCVQNTTLFFGCSFSDAVKHCHAPAAQMSESLEWMQMVCEAIRVGMIPSHRSYFCSWLLLQCLDTWNASLKRIGPAAVYSIIYHIKILLICDLQIRSEAQESMRSNFLSGCFTGNLI